MAKWLDKYEQGGLVLKQKTKDNYGKKENANEGYSTAGPGWVGEGTTNRGFNYNGAWGGTMQNGGFLQPTSYKLPPAANEGAMSTEKATSIGGGPGEPAYLIPTFKYGKPLKDPEAEYRKTGEHLGGPFKTWQEAEKFGEMRHQYVEQGINIPSPYKWWDEMQMGGSLPDVTVYGHKDPGTKGYFDSELLKYNNDLFINNNDFLNRLKASNYIKEQYNKGLDFHTKWLNSPMHNKMLNASDPENATSIAKERKQRLNSIKFNYNPNPNPDNNLTQGDADVSGNITIYPIGIGSNSLGTHEVSHVTDMERGKGTLNLIPLKDHISIMTKTFDKRNLAKHDASPKYNDYVAEPTETRARLNQIRQQASENKLYDPFNQKITPAIFNKLKSFKFEKNEGADPFKQLQSTFTDDQILELLNSVSKNQGQNLPQAEQGGSVPGAVGFTYARTAGAAPSNGKYAKKTKASAQDGVDLQKEWLTSYVQSPKYKERLGKEFAGQSDEFIQQENDARLNNLLNTKTKYVKSIGNSPGWISGMMVPKENKGEIYDNASKKFIKNKWSPGARGYDKKGTVYLENEYRPDHWNPSEGFETTPLHELGHAVDDAGYRIPASTEKKIHNYTDWQSISKSLNLPNYKNNGLTFDYYNTPSEFINRIQPIRYLLNKEGLYDARTSDFTEKDYDNMLKNKNLNNNQHYKDVMNSLKGDKKQKKKAFVDLMNTVAKVDDNENVDVAQNGKEMSFYQQGLDFTPKTISKNGSVIKDDMGQWAHPGEITEINSNNITNSHNRFNINVYLNETCRNAMNINEFVDSIQVGIEDLEETSRLGFVDGISRIIINNLNKIETPNRPIHCSDSKRMTIYVKSENKWNKNEDNKDKLKTMIQHVAGKNMKQIYEWQKLNPDYCDPLSKCSDTYQKMLFQIMNGDTVEESNENINKIIKNIAKETIIAKNLETFCT